MRRCRAAFIGMSIWLGFTACSGGDSTKQDPAAVESAPIPVASTTVVRESILEPISGTGTIAAHKTTDVGPRVAGIIDRIHVAVGDRVEAGAPLFRTRSIDYEIQVQDAEASLRVARANADKARRDIERVTLLHDQNIASVERLDAFHTASEMASAQLAQAQAHLAQARQNLADTIVRAPYRGVITRRYVDEGAMLSVVMTTGSAVLQIMKVDIVAAIVQLPEQYLARVHVGTPGRVRIESLGRSWETEVAVLNDRLDAASRAFEVRLPIENADYVLKPGLFAELELQPEPRDAMLLERGALQGGVEAPWVYVFDAGRAAVRPVRVRELDAARVEILEGLAPGDRVLVGPNVAQLADGSAVVLEVPHADR